MELLIRNGFVYDPLNGVNGEVMDIGVKNGKIVDPSEVDPLKAKVIDAKGKVVMPGGVDMHTHIAGAKVNAGRVMMPGDHYDSFIKLVKGVHRSGTGKRTPSTFLAGYRYAKMGWTTVAEPASPPLKTRHTHEELNDVPMVDKLCFLLLDSNRILLDYLSQGNLYNFKHALMWFLEASKCYAVKLVDPGVAVPWTWGRGYGMDLDDQIELFGLTPREIVVNFAKVNEELKLPHTIHVHCNKLGIPGNCETTLKTMDAVSGVKSDGLSIHITHIQFNSYLGDSWFNLKSGSEKIADYVNKHSHISLDAGQIDFGTAITMTADAPFEFALYHLARWKWAGAEVENECAAGIVPFKYKKRNMVNTVQWCIGLEVMLIVKDPWRVILSTDHPNGAPFTRYPKFIALLMSKKYREEIMKKLSKKGLKSSVLPAVEREYTLYEIVITTRAAPAKLLGIHEFKGHLGVGADADVAIYDLNPEEMDFSKDYVKVKEAFSKALYTIKGGEIVVKDGEVVKEVFGETIAVKFKERPDPEVVKDMEAKFREYYTVSFSNYVIRDEEIRKLKYMVCG
ncbi:MAG: formylmethanofuran dehydrogenase subunit A [Thermoprotei archaeon]|nr:MAG: formylmethanofuran dehydrogenase subunit A [Thermoprotei archaeon]